jgi:glycosyltransferase involved in cell wall biosynthesis
MQALDQSRALEENAMKAPLVSVVMPVYNGERYLRPAIDSILNQTFADFEFLIVDDASTDGTKEILESYSDKRIQVLTNETTQGISFSRNRGILAARGEFLAQMDADDVSRPRRFERQVEFLRQNPDVGLCGTWALQITAEGKLLRDWSPICDTRLYPHQFLFHCHIVNPSVMGRTRVFQENLYDPAYDMAEDYEFWTRLADKTRICNIEELLLYYRVQKESVSYTHGDLQESMSFFACLQYTKKLGLNFQNPETLRLFLDPINTPERFALAESALLEYLNQIPPKMVAAHRFFLTNLVLHMAGQGPRKLVPGHILRSRVLRFYGSRGLAFQMYAKQKILRLKIKYLWKYEAP